MLDMRNRDFPRSKTVLVEASHHLRGSDDDELYRASLMTLTNGLQSNPRTGLELSQSGCKASVVKEIMSRWLCDDSLELGRECGSSQYVLEHRCVSFN